MNDRKIYYFNPGYEKNIKTSNSFQQPTKRVQWLMEDLTCLALWYAGPDDLVWSPRPIPDDFLDNLPWRLRPKARVITGPADIDADEAISSRFVAVPWGKNRSDIMRYNAFARAGLRIQIPSWDPNWIGLFHRETSAKVLGLLREKYPYAKLPERPRFIRNMNLLGQFIENEEFPGPYVLKRSYTSSGQGVRFVRSKNLRMNDRSWLSSAFSQGQSVSIERMLNRLIDFAMEFYCTADKVEFVGYSLFKTNDSGGYTGNWLMSQERILDLLSRYVSRTWLDSIRESLRKILWEMTRGAYEGPVGVDMMIYLDTDRAYRVHPCVEINWRHTMGELSAHLFESLVAPTAKGLFEIRFYAHPDEALAAVRELQRDNPLTLDGEGRILNGYLSLCPVDSDTHFVASIRIPAPEWTPPTE